MYDLKVLSFNVQLRAGSQCIHKTAPILFIVDNGRTRQWKTGIIIFAWDHPPPVYLTSPHITRSLKSSSLHGFVLQVGGGNGLGMGL